MVLKKFNCDFFAIGDNNRLYFSSKEEAPIIFTTHLHRYRLFLFWLPCRCNFLLRLIVDISKSPAASFKQPDPNFVQRFKNVIFFEHGNRILGARGNAKTTAARFFLCIMLVALNGFDADRFQKQKTHRYIGNQKDQPFAPCELKSINNSDRDAKAQNKI